jgi:hypothetical protein
VLDIGALRAVGVNGELDVPSLLRMWIEACQRRGQIVELGRIEARFRTASTVVVLTDEDSVLEDGEHPAGRGPDLEDHVGEQVVALVVAVEVDLEAATYMRLVVRVVVER